MKQWIEKYKHGWVFLYFFFYLSWFFILENRKEVFHHTIHIKMDDWIPFQEIFIIPYLLWFFYIAIVVLYFFFQSKEDFYKCIAFLFTGMTICLIIYTVWPNGQDLRPTVFPRNNFFVDLVKQLYITDTPTNVCPSIHVFNSIGVHLAIMHSQKLKNKKWISRGSFILMFLICLSTVFLKQHSVFDGICAIILAAVIYVFVYKPEYLGIRSKKKKLGASTIKDLS